MEALVILKSTFQTIADAVIEFGPRFLATFVIVMGGLMLARLAKTAMLSLLELVHLDDLSRKSGATAALRRGDVGLSISEIVAKLVYWTLLVFTASVALNTLGFASAKTFAPILALVPDVLVGSAVLVIGLNVSSFVSKLIQTAAVNAEVRQARTVHNVAYYGMNALVIALAMRQLGVPQALVSQGFLILLASSGAALALAFGLGARELAAHIVTTSWKHEREQSHALAEASNLGRQVIPGVESISSPVRSGRSRAAATPA